MSVISVKDLFFTYDENEVLRGVTTEFGEGKLTGIIGPNGSGKTTLLRCISGYLSPKAGSVTLDSRPVSSYSVKELARKLALVPQSSILEYDFTVMDIVLMGRSPHMSRFASESGDDVSIAMQAMRHTGIDQLAQRSALHLSGGEWQRMIIARALAQQSDTLLLDEPVSSLDIRHQLEVMGLVRSLVLEKRLTAICVLHDLNLALHFCDKLVLMKNGRVVCEDVPERALRPELLHQVYGVKAQLYTDPDGRAYVHPHYETFLQNAKEDTGK